jgi:selenocysteine lyase/cysteine desulfurase
LVAGGTGSRSEHEIQPDFLPDKYEAGTPNITGLAGLVAGVRTVLDQGIEAIQRRMRDVTQQLLDGLKSIPGVQVFGPQDTARQTAVVSFVIAGQSPSQTAAALDERFGILCRPGLHCAPTAHRTLGTLPDGTVRFAPGPFVTPKEIESAVRAVRELAGVESHG